MNKSPWPSVVIVDDALEVRTLLRTHLNLSSRFEVVGEGSNGQEAIQLASEHQPDLLVLDISMPIMDGLEALPKILVASPETKVVLYSGFAEEGLATHGRRLGAATFIEKSASLNTLVGKLLEVLDLPAQSEKVDDGRPEPALLAQLSTEILDEHRERFHEVFEDAAIAMATLTLTGQFVRANEAFGVLLEVQTEAALGRSLVGLAVDVQGREQLKLVVEQLASGAADVLHLEHDIQAGNAKRTLLTTIAVVRSRDRQPLYLFLQALDVSGQRRANNDLRESEERFRLLVDAVEDYAIFMLDLDGFVVSWNSGAQRIKGYTAEQIVGQHFRAFYPKELQESRHPEHELELALKNGRYEEEGWRVRRDGTTFWANVVLTAAYDARNKHVGFAKVTRDVSRRRAFEEDLRQSEERFRLLVNAVEDYAIFMLDRQGHIASWNSGAQRIKGYASEEILGKHFRVFYPQDRQDAKHPEFELEVALADGHYEEEGIRIRKDGSTFFANVVITAVRNGEGIHVGFAKITRDITDRRNRRVETERVAAALAEANVELEISNDHLAQAVTDQSNFLAVTAHELRTPIGVLAGSAETLTAHWEKLRPDERGELLEGMTSSALRLRRLLNDLLTAARLESGALQFDLKPVAVQGLLYASAEGIKAADSNLKFRLEVSPHLFVLADSVRLGQAVDNVLGNAVHHGKAPVGVDVQVNGSMTQIRITDSGAGVTPLMEGRLFDRFATGAVKGGTGLGLHIARELLRGQGGELSYEPATVDRPHAFVLWLPSCAP